MVDDNFSQYSRLDYLMPLREWGWSEDEVSAWVALVKFLSPKQQLLVRRRIEIAFDDGWDAACER